MNQVSFVTTCKGRLQHIRQTLPLIVAQAPGEVIVVDYGCPQRVGDWVETNFKSVKVIRVQDDPGFCAARARNIGAQHASSPWLCLIDADVMISPGFVGWMRENLHPLCFYRHEKVNGERDPETWGTCICLRQAFSQVNGFDEVFRGWGGEDDDFFDRLRLSGYAEGSYPVQFVKAITHDDQERFTFQTIKSKNLQHIINRLYRIAKQQVMAFYQIKTELRAEIRKDLYTQIRSAATNWDGDRSKPLPNIAVSIESREWLPAPYNAVKRCSFTIEVIENSGPSQSRTNGIAKTSPNMEFS